MLIQHVLIEAKTEEKIFKKHGVKRVEVEGALLDDEPKYFRTKDERYMALAKIDGAYITVIFTHAKTFAIITTAYPSSDWQVRLYKRKMKVS